MKIKLPHNYQIDLPQDWIILEQPHNSSTLVAVCDVLIGGFAPSVVVTFSRLNGDADNSLAQWQRDSVSGLDQELDDLLVIDYMLQEEENAFRQLMTYVRDGRSLTLEQWVTRDREARVGITVSATVPTLAYLDFVEQMTAVAWTLEKRDA